MILKKAEAAPAKELFKMYHFLFKKKYSLNSEEGIKRYNIFRTNQKLIKEQNVISPNKYGINAFTDRNLEEYLNFETISNGTFLDFDKYAVEVNEFSHIAIDA